MKHGYFKAENLKSRKLIEILFKEGQSVKAFPLVAVYLPLPEGHDLHNVGVSVSKKRFKRAVDRNRIKRLMREAFRQNMSTVYDPDMPRFAVMFIYIGRDMVNYETVNHGMVRLLEKMSVALKT